MQNLKSFLDIQEYTYNNINFIANDPISIPHLFNKKEDIEIAAFLTALISWGNRTAIIKSARHLMELMDFSPFAFVLKASDDELERVSTFYYRTFNADDLLFLISALRNIYKNKGGLERAAEIGFNKNGMIKDSILNIRKELLENPHLLRTEKHLANPEKGSAAKRINMFLRWMVRKDNKGVDFGLWKNIPSSALMCPLDVHSGRVARQLGLLTRKQNDWNAVEELTASLRKLDNDDPIKYDFALFGMGISGQNLSNLNNVLDK
ncbi:MAG TPA: TIGR02757 family protein [Bacteroidales bacterium]